MDRTDEYWMSFAAMSIATMAGIGVYWCDAVMSAIVGFPRFSNTFKAVEILVLGITYYLTVRIWCQK